MSASASSPRDGTRRRRGDAPASACSTSRRPRASRSRARAAATWPARPATSIVAAADFARLPPASAEEEDLLDLVPAATRTSRLACQIVLTDDAGRADRPHALTEPHATTWVYADLPADDDGRVTSIARAPGEREGERYP